MEYMAGTRGQKVSHPVPPRNVALLEHLGRQMRRGAEEALGPLGLRPRHLVALTLLRESRGATQQSLGEALGIDPSNLVGLLNELEEASLARRRRDPTDRRRHIVELTSRGLHYLDRAERALSCVEDQVLAALSPSDRDILYALLLRAAGGHLPPCANGLGDDPGA
jgi:DNA-binding MarR family transcriptional regulator